MCVPFSIIASLFKHTRTHRDALTGFVLAVVCERACKMYMLVSRAKSRSRRSSNMQSLSLSICVPLCRFIDPLCARRVLKAASASLHLIALNSGLDFFISRVRAATASVRRVFKFGGWRALGVRVCPNSEE